jgi:hypothetical protein
MRVDDAFRHARGSGREQNLGDGVASNSGVRRLERWSLGGVYEIGKQRGPLDWIVRHYQFGVRGQYSLNRPSVLGAVRGEDHSGCQQLEDVAQLGQV